VNNPDETTAAKRFGAPGPKGMIHRVLVVLAAGLLAVSALYLGSSPVEATNNAPSNNAGAPGSKSSGVKISSPNSATVTVQEAERALEYWTPTRMANATPEESSPDSRRRGNGGTGTTRQTTFAQTWAGPTTRPPATTTGKLLFIDIGDPNDPTDDTPNGGWCSASTVNSPAKNLVFTAGHCLLDEDPNSVLIRNVVYVPGYRREGPPSTEDRPYGTWAVRRVVVHPQWADATGRSERDWGYDVGAVLVYPSNVTGGESLVDVVDANIIDFNLPAEQDTYVFGYPGNFPDEGGVLRYCQGQSGWNGIFDPRRQHIGCTMGPGSSGGPWLTAFGGERGLLHSVTSTYATAGSPEIHGILFDDSVKRFYNGIVGTDFVTPGTIAYSSLEGGDHEIYSADSDGHKKHLHTSNDWDDQYPSVPHNGGSLAYSSFDGNDWEIHTIGGIGGGGGRFQLTNNNTNDSRPSYSRDGRKITYEGHDGNDWEIYTIDATGGTPVPITNNDTDDQAPDYAPNGTSIAYQGYDGRDWEIYTIDATGGTPVPITCNTTNDWNPDYEPEDGRYIAYQGLQGARVCPDPAGELADYEIHVVRRRSEGGPFYTPVQITYNDTRDAEPSYSPVGRHIVYSGFDGRDWEIYRINRTFGHVRQLTNNVTDDYNPSWGRPPHPPAPTEEDPRPPRPDPGCPPPPTPCNPP
jgi:Tol biopolymer transport system component